MLELLTRFEQVKGYLPETLALFLSAEMLPSPLIFQFYF